MINHEGLCSETHLAASLDAKTQAEVFCGFKSRSLVVLGSWTLRGVDVKLKPSKEQFTQCATGTTSTFRLFQDVCCVR